MDRSGWEADLPSLAEQIRGIRDRLALLDAPYLEISGTELRRRVREGLPMRYLVPPAVERYVYEQGLYQHQASPGRTTTKRT
jgi:nicotinate-nucleotide adenylyltransferase